MLFSALAVFISIYVSIATNFHIASAAYAGTALCLYLMLGKGSRQVAAIPAVPAEGEYGLAEKIT